MDVVKVVVHALDHQMKTVVLSEKQVNLNQDDPVDALVLKLSKSLITSSTTSKAILKESSFLNDIVNQQFDFMGTSEKIAKHWFDLKDASARFTSCNLLFAMIDQEDEGGYLFTMFEVNSKPGYISVVKENETDIEFQGRILSESFGGIKNAFGIDLSSGELTVKTPLKTQDVMEEVLDCEIYLNTKNAVTVLQTVVDTVSMSRDEDSLMNIIKTKQLLTENAALFDEVAPKELMTQVFEDLSDQDQTLVDDAFETHHVENFLPSKQVQRLRAAKTHTIVTESGVEIKIPLDSVEVDRVLEIEHDDSGYATIHLKNIGKIL
ncbi:hypothetical protein AOC36_04240 [Erysipelothrix larvae]|uniref:Nucleoid-associated protein n=1 Tax=Erysipelothrix larvae TaxID=1514105 RepID=A0A109UGU2_9FIRM|nr:nucleoid-associated protein [Erysipelothrix larvae]AMC93208.1 hypothetical protein AOC36_04240 [Erysipelothrix larvae]